MGEQAVKDLVNEWAAAELAGDAAALDKLLTDDFQGVGPVGFVLDREQWTQRHAAGGVQNHELTVSDPHVRLYGDTAVVEAVETQRTTAMGMENSGSFRIAVVATVQDGRWVIAHVQFSGPMIAPGEVPPFARK
jgi:uncharacterized protein (TIGR02246 family)